MDNERGSPLLARPLNLQPGFLGSAVCCHENENGKEKETTTKKLPNDTVLCVTRQSRNQETN